MRLVGVIAASAVSVVVSLPAAASHTRDGSLLFEVVPAQVAPRFGAGGPVHLWAATPAGTKSRDLGVVAGNADKFADARFTPDGRRIVFLHAIDGPDKLDARDSLDVMNADGSGRRVLVRRPQISQFALSPDSLSVAYLAVDRKTVWSLYVTRIERPRPLLLHRPWPPAAFEWSKSGTMIVFGSQGRCETRLRRVDPNTGKAHPMAVSARLCQGLHQTPAVSPDESRIAFYSPLGPAGARVFAADGRFLRNIVGPYRCVGPFSPDGTQLALADSCGGTIVHLSVFDFRSRTVEPLTPHVPVPAGGYDRLLDWQPLGAGG
jgi:hypothetical protein